MKNFYSFQGFASSVLFLLLMAYQISPDREHSCPQHNWETSLCSEDELQSQFVLLHQVKATFAFWLRLHTCPLLRFTSENLYKYSTLNKKETTQ